MEREDYLDKIDSLTSVIEQFKESYSLLKAGMDSSEKRNEVFEKRNEALQSQVIRLQDIICTLTEEIRSLREEVSKQSDYTKRHNKMSYGKKSLSSRTKQDERKSREEEKMDDDGSGSPSNAGKDPSLDLTKVKSENIDKERGPRSFEVAVYEDEYGIRHDFIRMRIDKFTSSENSRSNWLKIGAKLLKPLCEHFKKKLLKVKSILNIDETWCRVRIKHKGDSTKLGKYFKKYVWFLVNKLDGLVYFLYDNDENDSRGCRPIEEFLGDFNGSIQSDGYVVYKHPARTNPENVHLLCWAHVRTKFKYAEEISKDSDASWFVEQIGLLYMVEAENIKLHRTADEIKLRRSRSDVTKTLAALHARVEKMIKNGKTSALWRLDEQSA